MTAREPFHVVIAGGGVAVLEGVLALHELAGDRVSIELLAGNAEFTYRPMTVAEPFAHPKARRYPLDEIAREAGAEPLQQIFHTAGLGLPEIALLACFPPIVWGSDELRRAFLRWRDVR